LFPDDATTTILEYQTANLSQLHTTPPGNYTIHQMERVSIADEEDDQVEEDERGKSSARSITDPLSSELSHAAHTEALGITLQSIGDFCNCNGYFDFDWPIDPQLVIA